MKRIPPRLRGRRQAKLVRRPPILDWAASRRDGFKKYKALAEYSDIVNDPDLRPKPTGKRPRRNDKRRPGKPGRR